MFYVEVEEKKNEMHAESSNALSAFASMAVAITQEGASWNQWQVRSSGYHNRADRGSGG